MEQFDLDKIEAYVLNDLSATERKDFELAIAKDKHLSQAVEDFKDTLQGIQVFGHQQFKQQIHQIDRDLYQTGFFLADTDLDAYLQGNATTTIRDLIEQRKTTDPAFAAALTQRADTLKGIEAFGDNDFLTNLKAIDQDLATEGFFDDSATNTIQEAPKDTLPKEAKVVSFQWRKVLSIAAAIGGFIIGIWVILQFFLPSNVFDENYVAYSDELTPYLEETGFVRPDYLDDLQVGMELYNAKDYTAAQLAFNNFLQTAPKDDQYYPFAEFYLAQSHFELGQIPVGVRILEDLSANPTGSFLLEEDVQWYLALGYIEMGETMKAKRLLEQLKTSEKYGKQVRGVKL